MISIGGDSLEKSVDAIVKNKVSEYVGTGATGDTIGLVIANVDEQISSQLHLDKKYHSLGILGARTGAGPHILAADTAVKATNTEVIDIEMPRDTKGGGGHGSLIIFGGDDVSDVRQAVQVALDTTKQTFGDVYNTTAGHLELQYTARASQACHKAFGAPEGKAYGLISGSPAAIGVIMADTAVKAANVDVLSVASPNHGTSFSNEVITHISGDSGAVRQAVIAAREIGKILLKNLSNEEPTNEFPSYI